MKARYFTTQSIDQQADDLYQQVAAITPIKSLPFQPSRSALFILDMQAYFLDPASHAYVPGGEAILGGMLQLIQAYSSRQLPIFFTQHLNSLDDTGMMTVWWRDVISLHNEYHALIPQIDVSLGTLIPKTQYDAFYQTPLAELLHARSVTQVVICGVMTHLCCETTARSAFMHGFEVFFPVDGTATYNLEHHRASLVNLAHGFACLNFVNDILQALGGGCES
jgi:isochorismate hydrolase